MIILDKKGVDIWIMDKVQNKVVDLIMIKRNVPRVYDVKVEVKVV